MASGGIGVTEFNRRIEGRGTGIGNCYCHGHIEIEERPGQARLTREIFVHGC